MNSLQQEYHGSPDQQALQRRADALWALVRDDPRFGSHGRAVCIEYSTPGQMGLQISMARLQGVAACEEVPEQALSNYVSSLEAAGLTTDQYEIWRGGTGALDAARTVLRNRPLPPDLELVIVDGDTSPQEMAALDALTQSCGVLLPSGAFMRGRERPAVCMFARDNQGMPVCASSAVVMFRPDRAGNANSWWGMLATNPERRGEGLALIMGAQSLLQMHDRFGITQFFTGIRAGNVPSQKLCGKLGFGPSGDTAVIAIDPTAFSGDRITK